ncbi:OsmC family protein [Oxalobacter sp. OttesenSCG-928-P03]|nr:OsmC family protein [Oxalobacter sp. OttesenSCG-928-P03]
MAQESFSVTLTHKDNYRFEVEFEDKFPEFDVYLSDEPEPMGNNRAPAPPHMLIAAVANCASASFMFAVNRAKQDIGGMVTKATCHIGRNENRHFRIVKIDVEIQTGKPASEIAELEDILSRFEGISTVARSVEEGIAMETTVIDSTGKRLK